MILAADSGSTKCDWVLIDHGKEVGRTSTPGFNPNFCDRQFILKQIEENRLLNEIKNKVNRLYFFGAGCSGVNNCSRMTEDLHSFFSNADVAVENDLMAAVIATCGHEPGIVCIIGTGSNVCEYDGKRILPNNFGLGYILADEGAGSYLGKKLVTNFLYGKLPDDLHEAFEKQYALTKTIVIKNVYQQPGANTWLAGLVAFLSAHHDHKWVSDLVSQSFREFLALYLSDNFRGKNLLVHFVGGVAYQWQDELKAVAKDLELQVGKILRQPADGLSAYFSKSN